MEAGAGRRKIGEGGVREVEEEKAEHERKLGDREKMGDLMLNISQSKNSQEVESKEKRGAYPRTARNGRREVDTPCPPRRLRSRTPSSEDLFVNDKANNSKNNTKRIKEKNRKDQHSIPKFALELDIQLEVSSFHKRCNASVRKTKAGKKLKITIKKCKGE